jgi:hypothetical protein
MVAEGGDIDRGDVLLEDFLQPLVKNWWIVLAASFFTLPPAQPLTFESQTKILLIAPLCERITSERGGVGCSHLAIQSQLIF